MAEALKNIGLSVLIPRFQNKNTNTETILKLTDWNLIEVKVTKLGDRLKEECRTLSQKIGKKINGSTNYDDDDDSNDSHNTRFARTLAYKRYRLFRPYSSGHALRRRCYAKTVHFRLSICSISGGEQPEKKPPKFWNANFVCLASMYSMEVSNSSEKEILHKAGCEVRTIKLNLHDNEDEVSKKLS